MKNNEVEFNVKFKKISDDEFDKFLKKSVLNYSEDLVKSGMCSKETAFNDSKKQFYELLPQGNNTKDNFIYIVVNNESEEVGHIWYKKYQEKVGFICDFLILEKFRKKGYGKETLLLLENDAKGKGFKKIFLHVFKFNENAIKLYKNLEYNILKEELKGLYMEKDI